MDPGLHITIPLLTSSLFSPRTRAPRLSPASARSRDLWNISIPEIVRSDTIFKKIIIYAKFLHSTLICPLSEHLSCFGSCALLFLSLTCNHWLEAAIVAHKLGVVSFLDDAPLHSAWHHRAPAWERYLITLQFKASDLLHFSLMQDKMCAGCISGLFFSYLGWNKPLRWAEGKVFPALFWAEEHKNPQPPAISSLHSHQAQVLCSEMEQNK